MLTNLAATLPWCNFWGIGHYLCTIYFVSDCVVEPVRVCVLTLKSAQNLPSCTLVIFSNNYERVAYYETSSQLIYQYAAPWASACRTYNRSPLVGRVFHNTAPPVPALALDSTPAATESTDVDPSVIIFPGCCRQHMAGNPGLPLCSLRGPRGEEGVPCYYILEG